ncbi:MAG: type II toxin-antitoxin system death-on-curing family toxin [Candidatus Cyclobacteriaceae bacterium M2_1C_046]
MISIEEVLQIHNILIERFGGSKGVRDLELLDSSISRPFNTFDQQDLYPTIIDKAAAIIESIVKNHPFVDGNKRTGYTLMRLLLLTNDVDIVASEDEKYDFVISIASGKFTFEQIKDWIELKVGE